MAVTDEQNIIAIASSDKEPGVYALYGENQLLLTNINTKESHLIAKLPNLQSHGIGDSRFEGKELEITIHYHHPYICVVERFGVNGALVNMVTGHIRELKRDDYHCDVSSYSVGFLENDGKTLFICQTEWNRLDIFDAESGKNLTEREISREDSGDRDEKYGCIIFEDKNYLDYFHSQLHISPDNNYFLSNGWIWQPYDFLTLYNVKDFFKIFEPGAIFVDQVFCADGYNWDRPCCFVDDETFVVILDDARYAGNLESDEVENYEYNQLAFYKIKEEYVKPVSRNDFREIIPEKSVKCTAFNTYAYGEVQGRLYYNKTKGYLVAVTPDGASAISLSGEILAQIPEAVFRNTLFNYVDKIIIGWDYSPEHHVLYSWKNGIGVVEKRFECQ